MNEFPSFETAGTVSLDNKKYRMVRPQPGQVSYARKYLDESPYEQSLPPEQVQMNFTWHLGGFKSHPGIPGSSEYGQNVDRRWPFRLMPGPMINDIALPGSIAVPTSIKECFGYLFVAAGRYIYRIDQSTNTVVLSKDLGGNVAITLETWDVDPSVPGDTTYLFVCKDNDVVAFITVSALVVGGPDNWVDAATTLAHRIVRGATRLFKISKEGVLKNITNDLDPVTETNWGDSVQVGERATLPNALLAFDRTVLVGKPEGLFAVGQEGFAIPQIKRMARDLSNCIGACNWDPYVIIPHSRGLYRFYPGQITDIGLETETLNESPVRGRITSTVADGDWLYFFVLVGSTTYLCTGRERKQSEAGVGPLILDTWGYFTGSTYASYVTSTTAIPRFYFGKGNNLSYITLSAAGGAPDVFGTDYAFAASGSHFETPILFDDWAEKDWYKVEAVGRELDASNYWILSYSLDGVTYLNQDASGATMKLSQSYHKYTFYLPRTAHSIKLWPKYDFVSNNFAHKPTLLDVEWFAMPQSTKLPAVSVILLLQEGLIHAGDEVETRTADEQLSDLETLIESVSPIVTTGPWGEGTYFSPRNMDIKQTLQGGATENQYIVEVLLQRRHSDGPQVM